MWIDYRGSLSTVYNDGEISTSGEIIEVVSMYLPSKLDCTYKFAFVIVM